MRPHYKSALGHLVSRVLLVAISGLTLWLAYTGVMHIIMGLLRLAALLTYYGG